MKINFNKYIQIAGIVDFPEAKLLIDCGVKFLGFPLRLPVNKEDLSEEEAKKIIKNLPCDVNAVLITYQKNAQEIISLCNYMGADIIQLHGDITIEELINLRQIKPNLIIIKSLIVKKNNLSFLEKITTELSSMVNAFITDTYNPVTGASGATGIIHDWKISRHLVEISNKPVILAGGLNPLNVRDGVISVMPGGVDVHTGVENSEGRKDKNLVNKFLTEAEAGFNSLNIK